MSKLIIVSNRLPVKFSRDDKGAPNFRPSVGGLATGLSSFHQEGDSIWIGWPGSNDIDEEKGEKEIVENILHGMKCSPVFLNDEELEKYYFGFSNKTIWPLFHYFSQFAKYEDEYWESYRNVNRKFMEEVLKYAEPGDSVWVHDYHLMLLPKMLRDRMPDLKIGYFLHIPFPSSELFRQIPYRNELLSGLLGSDLIGFHTYDYVRHFLESVRRILGYEHEYGMIHMINRYIRVDAFPIGIDYEKWAKSSKNKKVKENIDFFRKEYPKQKIILTIDRMDYSKGIPNRLESFDVFLEKYPEYIGKVYLIMCAVPSRTQVDTYQDLKNYVDELVGRINGKYGTVDWTPIKYLYRSLPFEELAALYNFSDIAMVTPVRDGMNLVAKEYIATRRHNPGVLILSESAGAAQELTEALIINPNDKVQIADNLKRALEMPEEEQIERNRMMMGRIRRYDIHRWAGDFLERLKIAAHHDKIERPVLIGDKFEKEILADYKKADKRLFLLDYDGTLVNFSNKPFLAKPDKELLDLLESITSIDGNSVTIISGRNKESLEMWFRGLKIDFIGEHGIWAKNSGGKWRTLYKVDNDWMNELKPILELFVDRTPGAMLEEKDYSLVWHYRNVNPSLVPVRVNELKNILINFTINLNIGIMEGNKVIEIKNQGINKGSAINSVYNPDEFDFIFCIGDDVTDEDMFGALPDDAYTVKVGCRMSGAKYCVKNVEEVRYLLNKFR